MGFGQCVLYVVFEQGETKIWWFLEPVVEGFLTKPLEAGVTEPDEVAVPWQKKKQTMAIIACRFIVCRNIIFVVSLGLPPQLSTAC